MSISAEKIKLQEIESDSLTLKRASKLLVYSFAASQGADFLQHLFFVHFHKTHPHWQIPRGKFSEQMFERSKKQVLEFVLPRNSIKPILHVAKTVDGPITEPTVLGTLRKEIEEMREAFAGEYLFDNKMEPWDNASKPALFEKIIDEMVLRDYKFLYTREGRTRTQETVESHGRDKWLSHSIEYVLRGRTTGNRDFDELYRELKAFILENRSQDTHFWREKFEPEIMGVLGIYNKYHPRSPFALTELESTR